MKTLITALVAIAISTSASAEHLHSTNCPKGCAATPSAVAPAPKSYDLKVAELNDAAENKNGIFNYNKTMQVALSNIDRQKHVDAIENIESENAYNNLMADMLNSLDQQILADQFEDLSAAQRFEAMMVSIFTETTRQ